MGAAWLQSPRTLPNKCAAARECQAKAGETPVKSALARERRGILFSAPLRDINRVQMNTQKMLMNASTTLVLMASASTQTALFDVNVPWDTAWTLVESDVKTLMSVTSAIPVAMGHVPMSSVGLSVHAMRALSLDQ